MIVHQSKSRADGKRAAGKGCECLPDAKRRLYNIMNEEPELLYDAKVAVKAVGRSAASMMADGGVAQVFAEYISQQAYDTLTGAGIKVSFDKKLDHREFLEVWRKLGE